MKVSSPVLPVFVSDQNPIDCEVEYVMGRFIYNCDEEFTDERKLAERAYEDYVRRLRRAILSRAREEPLWKVEHLVWDYCKALRWRNEIIEDAARLLREAKRYFDVLYDAEFPVRRFDLPVIDLDDLPIPTECEGEIESGCFPLNDWLCLGYLCGRRVCEGKDVLEFEWGTVEVTRRKVRDVNDSEHCTFYSETCEYTDAKVNVKEGYGVVTIRSYGDYRSFYGYTVDSNIDETIVAASHEPVAILKTSSYSTITVNGGREDGTSDNVEYLCVFPKGTKVLVETHSWGYKSGWDDPNVNGRWDWVFYEVVRV